MSGWTLIDTDGVLLRETFTDLDQAARRTRELPWSVALWGIWDAHGRLVRDWQHDVYTYQERTPQ